MRVAVLGAGMMGLCTAMLLAEDGHDVTVVDRDREPPPDPQRAWESWDRRGVNQFRLAHFFLTRFRSTIEAELPSLAADLTAAGACRYNVIANVPAEFKGGARPDDDRFDTLTGRRAVFEAVTARAAESTRNVTIRRGAAVESLLSGTSDHPGVPNVVGVRLAGGSELTADLVIDATGRRSPLPRWLDALGCRPPVDDVDDSGFVYYGRHFASPDGSLPVMIGAPKQDAGSIGVLTLPADNGTWSVTLTASSEDTALRGLRDPDKWEAVVKQLPLAAHWLDGTPIDDRVAVMAKLEDRIRDIAPGGKPVATGIFPVADAWSCTNPSLGRGASVGILHAVALRDFLREENYGDPWDAAIGWATTTHETVEPWFRTTVAYDRQRLAEMKAFIDGRPFESDDRTWRIIRAFEMASMMDGDHLRSNIEMAMMVRHPDEVMGDEETCERVLALAEPLQHESPMGPDRDQLLAVVA